MADGRGYPLPSAIKLTETLTRLSPMRLLLKDQDQQQDNDNECDNAPTDIHMTASLLSR